jgi:hypothetical protein
VIQEQYGMNNKEKDATNYLKLTFKSGTGDAPDDWYVVYADKQIYLKSSLYRYAQSR